MTAKEKDGRGYYVVLVNEKIHSEAEATWQIADPSVAARSAEHAVRLTAATGASAVPRVFVAVPARSWSPVRVTPKVETTLLIEEA